MKWKLQIQRKPVSPKLLRPAVMPRLSLDEWSDWPMPKRIINPTEEQKHHITQNMPSRKSVFKEGPVYYEDDGAPMATLEEAMDRWQDYPKWNTHQFDFRLIEKETGEIIPLFLL